MTTTTVSVNAATSAGAAVLHFAFVPLALTVAQAIADNTAPSVIPANTTIAAIDRAAQTVTMSANATGAGVGSSDSFTFTASDTLDEQALYNTIASPQFLYRVQARFLSAATAIMAGSPTAQLTAFCGALFLGRVSLQIMAEAVINNPTNRANCLLDATMPGGKMLNNDIDFQVSSVFTLMANSRNWAN